MKLKKLIYILCAGLLALVLAFRITAIARENHREVFNAARLAEAAGFPVETIIVKNEKNLLKEPLHVRKGKAFVSAARKKKFKMGQKVASGGFIISVSRGIDLDTGLYAIGTSSPDGETVVLTEHFGAALPLSAISSGKVFIAENGAAVKKEVKIVSRDSENAVVSGLSDGDAVINSKIEEHEKVFVIEHRQIGNNN
jgi:hypothetical protein